MEKSEEIDIPTKIEKKIKLGKLIFGEKESKKRKFRDQEIILLYIKFAKNNKTMVQPMSKQYLNRNSLSRFVMCDKSILKIFWPMLMFIHFAGANPISHSFFTPALIKNIITGKSDFN